MIAYVLPGVGPLTAATDKRMERLLNVGPWQYQLDIRGSRASWRTDAPLSRSSFGEERPTDDGMIYLPPKVMPAPDELLRNTMRQRPQLVDVQVSQDTGERIKIMPTMMTPRQILEDNSPGDYTTKYGRSVRALLGRMIDKPDLKFNDYKDDLLSCARLAVMYAYRVTKELLQDTGWINEESVWSIWEACIHHPKETEPAKSEDSPSLV